MPQASRSEGGAWVLNKIAAEDYLEALLVRSPFFHCLEESGEGRLSRSSSSRRSLAIGDGGAAHLGVL